MEKRGNVWTEVLIGKGERDRKSKRSERDSERRRKIEMDNGEIEAEIHRKTKRV